MSRTGILMRLWWTAVLTMCAVSASAQQPSDRELIADLRGGGFVIYFRHADTGPAYVEPPTVDLARCETQRNLDDNGRAQAAEIGRQFQRLGIPVGPVLSSEFCRCRDTAQLAFGRYEIAHTLTGVRRDPEHAQARQEASRGLRMLLSTPPPAGRNTVLVSHGFNLIDLEGLYLSVQGEAAIYRPDGAGGYSLVARVPPEQWRNFTASD